MVTFRFLILSTLAIVCVLPQAASAQVTGAQIKKSVADAAAYLRQRVAQESESSYGGLAAYALLKAGDPPNSPAVQGVLNNVVKRAGGGNYKPGSDGIYGAGVEMMLLEAANPQKYRKEMEAIVAYLIKHQHSSGSWDYVDGFRGGDTSQCQYAMLGFWAAERSGIKVPPEVWDRGAAWFIKTQSGDGGYSYHPFGSQGDDTAVSHTMTAAGVGSLLMARMHLYPNAEDPTAEKPKKPATTKFGVLESVDLDTVEKPDGTKVKDPNDYHPTVTSGNLTAAANRAAGWIARRYTITAGRWNMYYLYTFERMAALMNVQTIANHDWYREGATYLVTSQAKNGSWNSTTGEIASTAFGILFLTKATAKILHRDVPFDPLGNGLLAGGRGLPDDLSQAILKDGKVESKKDLGPIDELLQELEKVETVDVAAAQEAIVEQVQLGDREELIKQKDRLVKLAKHPNVEVRRTAIWALGRTEDLGMAKLLIEALDDNNVDVMVEARNALCTLSRKPLGFHLPETPFEKVPASADQKAKDAAVAQWRKQLEREVGRMVLQISPL